MLFLTCAKKKKNVFLFFDFRSSLENVIFFFFVYKYGSINMYMWPGSWCSPIAAQQQPTARGFLCAFCSVGAREN